MVNGLQTSQELYQYFSQNEDKLADKRKILVRVIKSESSESQDRIIRATNRQTAISGAQLHSTEGIHRDIERIFPPRLFYDRRGNNWKYKDKPKDSVVGIRELAQIVLAIFQQRPDSARARPGETFAKKNVAIYEALFPSEKQLPLNLYLSCARLHKRVERFLRTVTPKLDRRIRNDLRFYVSMCVTCLAAKTAALSAEDLAALEVDGIAETTFSEALDVVKKIYDKRGGTEKVAKGSDLLADLKATLAKRFPSIRFRR